MISEERIRELVEKSLQSSASFIAGVRITSANRITVLLDNDLQGISISDCVEVSRSVEAGLNRDEEDFELEVSSAGIGEPFLIARQYKKNLGKQVQVLTREGKKITGKLVEASDNGIVVEEKYKERLEGKKKRQIVVQQNNLDFENIKETKLVLSF